MSLVSINVVFSDMNIATMGVIYKAIGGASRKAEERNGLFVAVLEPDVTNSQVERRLLATIVVPVASVHLYFNYG